MKVEKFVEHKSRIREYFEVLHNAVYTSLLYTKNNKLKTILTEYEEHLTNILPLINSISIDGDINHIATLSASIGCTGMDTALWASETEVDDSSIDVIFTLSKLIEKEMDTLVEEKERDINLK